MKMKYKSKEDVVVSFYGAAYATAPEEVERLFDEVVGTLRAQEYDLVPTGKGFEIVDVMV
jgi:hypothetical protein